MKFFITIYLGLLVCSTILWVGYYSDENINLLQKYGTLNKLYKNTSLNWFGCIVVYLLLCLSFGTYLIGTIYYFIKWLFTAGKKKIKHRF